MLYLNMQKGEEVTKILEFHKEMGGMDTFMKIIMKDSKGLYHLSSNNNLFDYIRFMGVNKVEAASAEI